MEQCSMSGLVMSTRAPERIAARSDCGVSPSYTCARVVLGKEAE
jgi:hypothetical protein